MHLQIGAKHAHSSSVRLVSPNERLKTTTNSSHVTPDSYNWVSSSELVLHSLIVVKNWSTEFILNQM